MPNWVGSLWRNRKVWVPLGCAGVVAYLVLAALIIFAPLVEYTRAIDWTIQIEGGSGRIKLGSEGRIYASNYDQVVCLDHNGEILAELNPNPKLVNWSLAQGNILVTVNQGVYLWWVDHSSSPNVKMRVAALDADLDISKQYDLDIKSSLQASLIVGPNLRCVLLDTGELIVLDTEFEELWRSSPASTAASQQGANMRMQQTGEMASPVQIDAADHIYFNDSNNLLTYFAPDGTELWQVQLAGQQSDTSFLLSGDQLYLHDGMGTMQVLDLAGNVLWYFAPPLNSASQPRYGNAKPTAPVVASDGAVYFVSRDTILYCLEPDETKRWEHKLPGDNYYSYQLICQNDGGVVVYANYGTSIAFAADGSPMWSKEVAKMNPAAAISPDGIIYYFQGDNLTALDSNKL